MRLQINLSLKNSSNYASHIFLMLFFLFFATSCGISGAVKKNSVDETASLKVQEAYGNIPLYFIENQGQVDGKVKYFEKGGAHATFFTSEGVYLSLSRDLRDKGGDKGPLKADKQEAGKEVKTETIKLSLSGANKDPEIIAEERQEGKVNYLTGNDRSKWKMDVPTYRKVVYKEVYNGIDVKYYGNNSRLEYDVIVRPGSDHRDVKFSYQGIKGLNVTDEGNLEIALEDDNIIQSKPYIYQDINGKRVEVEGSFRLIEDNNKDIFTYGFQVAAYDERHDLIIDPVLVYSTYIGGGAGEYGYGIAVDLSGSAYISGITSSTNFMIVSPFQGAKGAGSDVFVTKFTIAGNSLAYSTYLGGNSDDYASSIAVDSSGRAYITGSTYSTNFPTLLPAQATNGGSRDAFVTKLNPAGNSLAYSTYLGGSGFDTGESIAVDSSGNAYITGSTSSTNFPTLSQVQDTNGGGYDAFVTKLNPAGNSLAYSTYLGGGLADYGNGITVDSSGNAYITGSTSSTNFPMLSPVQGINGGSSDVFVTKLGLAGNSLVYSTYLGGSNSDSGHGIAVDSSGNTYITGSTSSTNFPMLSPVQGFNRGGGDAFVTKLGPAGNSLVYSTYLGGSNSDTGWGIALDSSGSAHITGVTSSTNFPVLLPVQSTNRGGSDAFVTKFNTAGNSLVYSTYLGGTGADSGQNIAVDLSGSAYITGNTSSSDFPRLIQTHGTPGGGADAFVAKLAFKKTLLSYSAETGFSNDGVNPDNSAATDPFDFKVVAKNADNIPITAINVCIDGTCYPMVKDSSASAAMRDNNFIDGEQYVYSTTLPVGTHNYYFTATDQYSTSRLPTTGTLNGPTAHLLKITTPYLPDGSVARVYSVQLAVEGGNAPYTWSAPSGGLPPGLILNTATGVISGTPTTKGTYGFNTCVRWTTTFQYCKTFTIIVNLGDIVKPVGSLSINNGALYTNSASVTLTPTATDDSGEVTQMRFLNAGGVWSAWETYKATRAWKLSAGTGSMTVSAQYKDAAGNVSAVIKDSITIELAPPVGSILINNDALSVKSTDVNLNLWAWDNTGTVSFMSFSNDKLAWSAWEPYNVKKAWTLTAGGGEKTVYVKYKDVSGNISSPLSDTILLDLAPPTGTIAINNGAASTESTAVTLRVTAADNSGSVSKVRVSNDNVTWNAWEPYSAIIPWTLTNGAGIKTVYVQVMDTAGRISPVYSDTITLNILIPAGTANLDISSFENLTNLFVENIQNAIRLPNGKVLAMTHCNGSVPCTSKSYLYDQSGTWTPAGDLGNIQVDSSNLLLDGRVLVVGGHRNSVGSLVSSARVYNPNTGAWTVIGGLLTPRFKSTSYVRPDGKVLVIGGYNNNYSCSTTSPASCYDVYYNPFNPTPNSYPIVPSVSTISSAELFNPVTGAWAVVGGSGEARTGRTGTTALPNGDLLITGGVPSGNAWGGDTVHLWQAELFNPVTYSSFYASSMTTARGDHTSTLLPNGKVLVVGGYNGINALNTAEIYDPALGSWVGTANMTYARSGHSATLLPNGKVIVIGGDSTLIAGVQRSTAEIYDPATDKWTLVSKDLYSSLPVTKWHTATQLPNGKIFILGKNIAVMATNFVGRIDPKVTPGALSNTITWNAVPGALSYNIYWSTSMGDTKKTGIKIGNLTGTSYTHTQLRAGIDYYYVITAVTANGETTETRQVKARPYLPAPTAFSADAVNGHVTLTWDSVLDATSYDVYWSTSPGVSKSTGYKISNVKSPFTHTNLNSAKTYYYVVAAVKSGYGESGESEVVSATPGPMAPPSGLSFKRVWLQTDVSWTGVPQAASYNIYWSTTVPNVGRLSGQRISNATNPYLHSGLKENKRYYYVVTAVDSLGIESKPSAIRSIYITAINKIDAGSSHSVVLRDDGTVWASGLNSSGQLGDGTTVGKSTTVQVKDTAGNPFSGVMAIAAGASHTVAAMGDGTVWAWGVNNYGQLGDRTTVNKSVPVQVKDAAGNPFTGVTAAIAAGSFHTVALKGDGTVWGWGRNDFGQLGDGTTVNKSSPVQVKDAAGKPFADVMLIAPGLNYTVAVKQDGTVWAWGYNGQGQLGDGTTANKSAPVQVKDAAGNFFTGVKEIAAGDSMFALKGDGTVWTLGYGYPYPVQVKDAGGNPFTGVTAIAKGTSQKVALKGNGTVWAWGINDSGQLGDGTTVNKSAPVQVLNIVGVKAIAAGSSHTMALMGDGTVWAWGNNSGGQLGDGTSVNKSTPVQTTDTALKPVTWGTAITAGFDFTVALKGDDTVWAWGNNNYGQLGDGTTVNKSLPVQVKDATGNPFIGVKAIAADSYHTIALKGDGMVWGWGYNNYGQLGDGTVFNKSAPVLVKDGAGNPFSGVTAIAAGKVHTIALKGDGTVWAWGLNGSGQLGDGTTVSKLTPVQVKDAAGNPVTGITLIAAGDGHTIALKGDGTVWGWGYNGLGQLGDGTTVSKSTPVQVKDAAGNPLTGITAIAAGDGHTIALKGDGTVWAWGYNATGQLGDRTTVNKTAPVQVKDAVGNPLSGVKAIVAATNYTVALKGDGTVWAWGNNSYGQLGDGTTVSRSTPVQVRNPLTGVTAIAADSHHTVALKGDGTVWAWGYNSYGQLADGTAVNRSTPAQVKEY